MIGIIIVNYNSFQDTVACIKSIEKATEAEYKIFVVDNQSTDCSLENLSKEYAGSPQVEIIASGRNGGYSAGNNIGIKKALGENITKLVISNSDIIFYKNAVEKLVGALSEEIKVAGPSIRGLDGKEQQVARRKIREVDGILGRKPFVGLKMVQKSLGRFYDWDGRRDYEFVGMVSGCCFAVDGEWLKKQGFLDENIFLYFEEDVMSFYLGRSRKRCKICPAAKVLHKHSKTISKEGKSFSEYYRWLSNLYVIKQYAGARAGVLFYMAFTNLCFWAIKSALDQSYRDRMWDFAKDNIKLLHRKRQQCIK